MSEPRAFLRLPLATLWLTLPPLATIVAAGMLIQAYGTAAGPPAMPKALWVPEAAHAEAAGRITALASWMLLTAVSLTCIGYFIRNLRFFTCETKRLLIVIYLVLSVLGTLLSMTASFGPAERMIGERAVCGALRLARPQQPALTCPTGPTATASECGTDAADQRLAAALGRLIRPGSQGSEKPAVACANLVPEFRILRNLNLSQRILLPWVSPALVLGAISCLAFRKRPSRRTCQALARRLNTYLYLTATMLVSGMLFLSALLQWPDFAYSGAPLVAWREHGSAFLLYWGVAYSLFIASYYVPIAVKLANCCGGAVVLGSGSGATAGGAVETLGPLDLLKVAAGIFAPAITGLLGSIMTL